MVSVSWLDWAYLYRDVYLWRLGVRRTNGIHEKKGLFRFCCVDAAGAMGGDKLAGWIVAEYGRQPWTVTGILPTHLSASSVSAGEVLGVIGRFCAVLYRPDDCGNVFDDQIRACLGPTVLTEK